MIDEIYMRRALDLAWSGFPSAFPNPMVGAVIVDPDGNIIGEGYHRRCGYAHAEVNAVNSVRDKSLLKYSTIYVSLEPCAHYGRTPPCSKLIVDCGIPNVVIGTLDPFSKVNGKGVEMLRQAGINVTIGVLERECQTLNAVFFTAHSRKRPFVILKWAQTADGYTDIRRRDGSEALKISNPLTSALTHRLRAACSAIMVGSGTVLADNPTLKTRLWPGQSPLPVILDRRQRISDNYKIRQSDHILINEKEPLSNILHSLYDRGITSLLVEGGPTLLQSFIDDDDNFWDLARVEVSPVVLGNEGASPAPKISIQPVKSHKFGDNLVNYYTENPLIDVKNI